VRDAVEIGLYTGSGSEVTSLAARQQHELIEEGKRRGGWLMNGCHHDEPMPDGHFLDVIHDFKARRRIKATGGLIQKENAWISDELARDTESSFLAPTDTLADGCTNQGVGLVLDAKCVEQIVDALPSFFPRDRRRQSQASGEANGLLDSQ
jgi:hypothetical protein